MPDVPGMGGMRGKLARAAARRMPEGDLPPQLAALAGPSTGAPSGPLVAPRAAPPRGGSKKKKGGRVTPPKHR